MAVKRIVATLATSDVAAAKAFYHDVLGLDVLMDHGWIATLGSPGQKPAQVSVASAGGSGAPVPALSIEVDDLEDMLSRLRAAQVPIVYGPADEPWGVRRFFVRDPSGALVNILMHTA